MPGHLNTNPNPSSIASPCSNANPSPSPNPSLGAVKVRPACGPGQLCVYVFILPLMCMWGGGRGWLFRASVRAMVMAVVGHTGLCIRLNKQVQRGTQTQWHVHVLSTYNCIAPPDACHTRLGFDVKVPSLCTRTWRSAGARRTGSRSWSALPPSRPQTPPISSHCLPHPHPDQPPF